jgi:hypothetical protein
VTLAAAVCFVVAALAELSGILLIVREAQAAQRALKEWRGPASVKDLDGSSAAFRRRDVTLAHYQQEADDVVIAHLLGSQAKRWAAVALLFVGVLAGTLGNFLSLSW